MTRPLSNLPEVIPDDDPVVFLHGWCGHPDEVESIRSALPGRVLALPWMPAPGSFDLETWPLPNDRPPEVPAACMRAFGDDLLESIRRRILDAGFAGATLIGHSMGGAMACVLAADPALAVRRLLLLDSSAPMPPDRRDDYIDRMVSWIDRAATSGRLVAQAAWIAEASSWVPDFFSLEDQGPMRMIIERRFLFAPVVEAALAIGGGVQWPINESLASLSCEIHALATHSSRMPVEAMRELRSDVRIDFCEESGHFVHRFAADRTRAWLRGIFSPSSTI